MKIAFLVHSLYSLGGTIRTTLNTAGALLDRGHDVEIISMYRRRTRSLFRLDGRLRISSLMDIRSDTEPEPLTSAEEQLAARASKVFPPTETRFDQYHRLIDARVAVALKNCDADVIVGTRPGINVYVAAFAPKSAVRIGQEHLSLDHHGRRLARKLYKTYRALDAMVTVSATDAEQYRQAMPKVAKKVSHIPNSVPPTPLPLSNGKSKLIVAAGRLEPIKRFDLLLRAFSAVLRKHPDWRLRIYGHGRQSRQLREMVTTLGINHAVMVMGAYTPLDTELVKASIAAVTSDFEAFGLTIVEAMSCGLPVVATDCPHGPGEIITDGADGVLTPPGDEAAFAAKLCDLIEDPDARERMAKGARETARQYSPASVAGDYEELFTRLVKARGRDVAPARSREVGTATRLAGSARSASFEEITLRLPEGQGGLKRRGNERELPPADENGEIRLDSDYLSTLSQGIWTVLVDGAKLPADRVDSRRLLSPPRLRPPVVAVPFSRDGVLAIRVWQRPVYPEIESVEWDDAEMSVKGRFFGDFGEGLRAVVISRDDPTICLAARVTVTGSAFTMRVDGDSLADRDTTGTQLWDLRLRDDELDLPLCKVFDDVAQRKNVHRLAHRRSTAGRRVQPYFNVDNYLSLKIDQGASNED